MKFIVREIGTYWGEKTIEAINRKEAIKKYILDPCDMEDYTLEVNQFEVERKGGE